MPVIAGESFVVSLHLSNLFPANSVCFNRNPLVMIAALSLPLGYLLAPSSVTPLWLLLFLFIFISNLKSFRLGILEILIVVAFPVYAISLALAFNTSPSFPLSHCLAIFVCLLVYGAGKYLFSLINYPYFVVNLAHSYWILVLIVVLEFFINATGSDRVVPEFIRVSGFSGYSNLQRVSGFWIEPGHLGIAINFLFPFVIMSKALVTCDSSAACARQLVTKKYFIFVFTVALLCSFATRSSPTIVTTIVQGLVLANPIVSIPFVAIPFSLPYLKVVPAFLRKRSSVLIAVAMLLALVGIAYYVSQDVKIFSLFSYLFQLDAQGSRDILSAGDRATRIQWVIDRIQQVPWGHGISPYYRSGAATDFSDPIALQLASPKAGYESSLSTPLDFALWASPLWPILVFLYIFRSIGRSSSVVILRSRLAMQCSYPFAYLNWNLANYCLAVMLTVVFAMLIRFCFVGNYYYPFLFLSIAFASSTEGFLIFLFSRSLGSLGDRLSWA